MSLFTRTIMAAEPVTSYDGLVIIMGLGLVFVGLICLIAICYLLGAILKRFNKNEEVKPAPAAPVAAPAAPIENRQELIAAISCVIAEELGTSVSAIRIKSIKKI
ncbi:MAG: OadG family protein [Oscillospiraceae bacterium]|nr:OadG family protein [Oscillospiraceae bacterium]